MTRASSPNLYLVPVRVPDDVGPTCETTESLGESVALSADGNTLVAGAPLDNQTGGALVFTRTSSGWTQLGDELIGSGAIGKAQQGYSVSISGDGATVLIGGLADNENSGATWVFTRVPQPASLILTPSLNPVPIGQPVTLTASVMGSLGTAPTGTVQCFDGATPLGTFTLTLGSGSITATFLTLGVHNIVCNYSGDTTYAASSSTYALSVTSPTYYLLLTSSSGTTTFGQPATFTARIASQLATGIPAPSGQVQFFSGTCFCGLGGALTDRALIGSATLSNAVATVIVSNLPVGSHLIVATYFGDANFSSANSNSITQTIAQAATSITWNALASNSSRATLAVNVTAVLPGSGTPTGTVQFVDMSSNLVVASAPVAGGLATAAIASQPNAKGIALIASYLGDTNFLPSASLAESFISITDAAGYNPSSIAPDEIAAIIGSGFATAANTPTTTTPPTSVSGVTVQVTDSTASARLAPLLFVSPAQINALVPSETATGPATVAVTSATGVVFSRTILITSTAPGLFAANGQGTGFAAAEVTRVHPDGSQDTQNVAVFDSSQQRWVAVPIDLSDATVYLSLFGTGIRHRATDQSVTCTINGESVNVLYSGPQGSFPGLNQVNVELPTNLQGAGTVNVIVTVQGQPSNAVTIFIQ